MTSKKRPTDAELLKPTSNFAIIKFDYGREFVLPTKNVATILELFDSAEVISAHSPDDGGDSYRVVRPVGRHESLEIKQLSKREYLDCKMSHLMGTKVKGAI